MLFFKMGFCTNQHPPPAGHIRFMNSFGTVNGCPGWKIGAFDDVNQIRDGTFWVIHQENGAINDLAHIMRGDVGSHTNSNTHRPIHQQVWETGGQYNGFNRFIIKVGDKIHHAFFNIHQHFTGDFGHSCFGIAVSGSTVPVYVTEVSVSIHQWIPQREGLRQTNHGIIHGTVAMGMIMTQHVADGGCRLSERLIAGQTVLIHGVQDSAVNRLQAVSHIRKSSANDHRHCIINITFPYFFFYFNVDNILSFKVDFHIQVILSAQGLRNFFANDLATIFFFFQWTGKSVGAF